MAVKGKSAALSLASLAPLINTPLQRFSGVFSRPTMAGKPFQRFQARSSETTLSLA